MVDWDRWARRREYYRDINAREEWRRQHWPPWLYRWKKDGMLAILVFCGFIAALVVFYAAASQLIFWLLS